MVCYRPNNLSGGKSDLMASLLSRFHCENVEVVISFDEKQFNKKEFFKSFPKPRNSNRFIAHLGSSNPKNPDHVHLELSFRKQDSKLRVIFHSYKFKTVDSLEGMTLETCVSWISSLLKDFEYATIDASFEFGKGYIPVTQFDYPLLVNNEHLKGAVVSGYSLTLPPGSVVSGMLVLKGAKNISVYVNAELESPKNFDLREQLLFLCPYAKALVNKAKKNG